MSLSQSSCREVAHQVPFLIRSSWFFFNRPHTSLQVDVLAFQEQCPLFQIDGADWRNSCRPQTEPIVRASHAVLVGTRLHGSLPELWKSIASSRGLHPGA